MSFNATNYTDLREVAKEAGEESVVIVIGAMARGKV